MVKHKHNQHQLCSVNDPWEQQIPTSPSCFCEYPWEIHGKYCFRRRGSLVSVTDCTLCGMWFGVCRCYTGAAFIWFSQCIHICSPSWIPGLLFPTLRQEGPSPKFAGQSAVSCVRDRRTDWCKSFLCLDTLPEWLTSVPLYTWFHVAFELVCLVHESVMSDLSWSVKCHVTLSPCDILSSYHPMILRKLMWVNDE